MRPSTSDPSKHHVGPSNEKDNIALSNKQDSRVCLGTSFLSNNEMKENGGHWGDCSDDDEVSSEEYSGDVSDIIPDKALVLVQPSENIEPIIVDRFFVKLWGKCFKSKSRRKNDCSC